MDPLLDKKKLTKKFLLALPEGVFLISDAMKSAYEFVFAESVEPSAQREVQWARIKKARMDGRLCHVYKSKEEVDTLIESWRTPTDFIF